MVTFGMVLITSTTAVGHPMFNEPAACTSALEQQQQLGPSPEQQKSCLGPRECPRRYSLDVINCSARDQGPTNVTEHRLQHKIARTACLKTHGVLPSGGWCLIPPPNQARKCSGGQYDTNCMMHVQATGTGTPQSYFMPKLHFAADGRVVALLHNLLLPDQRPGRTPSLVDIGAGVGQVCAALLAMDSRRDCRSYDGAGNVQEITGGTVKWADLSKPLSVPKADWAVSFEVGEHMPNHLESMLIRNLHASNCRGVVLSWGAYYPGMRAGHEDVNYHSKHYLVGIFEELGYRYLGALTAKYMRTNSRPRQPWYDHNMVGVLERLTPRVGGECGEK